MLFPSMEFLFIFFPVTLGVYFFLPNQIGCHNVRNYWLLIASLFFYAWGEPKFVLVMLFSIVFNYFAALHIEEAQGTRPLPSLLLAVDVLVNIGILFVFKYMNFVTGTLLRVFPRASEMFEQTSFVLPIGISFFTFQALSYVIDVYRGAAAQKNICYLGLYISFFPQLIAGPIVRYTTIAEQIKERRITAGMFSDGVLRFLYGFNKKVLLANAFAEVADIAFSAERISVGMAWLGAVCYTLQIFFDFSGYSDMAIGLGKMFGFRFLENFNYPYISKTVTEFWRRWHISLGSWFRDYVYFPLGGSRVKSKTRLVFNLFVAWLATGIWHGASWNFIAWGLLYGVLITAEKLWSIPEKVEKHRLLAAGYQAFTLLAVVLGWVLFRSEGLSSAGAYIRSMCGLNGNSLIDNDFIFYVREYAVVLAAGILLSTPALSCLKNKVNAHKKWMCVSENCAYALSLALFIVSVSFLVMNAHNPFIYFNF